MPVKYAIGLFHLTINIYLYKNLYIYISIFIYLSFGAILFWSGSQLAVRIWPSILLVFRDLFFLFHSVRRHHLRQLSINIYLYLYRIIYKYLY